MKTFSKNAAQLVSIKVLKFIFSTFLALKDHSENPLIAMKNFEKC